MPKIFVIAGNQSQAKHWINTHIQGRMTKGETTLSLSEYCIVSGETTLIGIANPSGYFVGTWKERHDLDGIFMRLLSHTEITTTKHRVLNRLYGEWQESQGRVVYQ